MKSRASIESAIVRPEKKMFSLIAAISVLSVTLLYTFILRHSRENGNPVSIFWIPASAGMTGCVKLFKRHHTILKLKNS